MPQTVIGLFDSPDAAYAAEEALMKQGVDQSSIYFSAKKGAQSGIEEAGQSMEAIRSFLGDIFGSENSQEAEGYVKEIEQGSILVSVDLPDDKDVTPFCEAMQDAGALDLGAPGAGQGGGEETQAEGRTVQEIEEQLEVGKRQVGQGKVRVVSRVVETPVQEQVSLKEERATVSRRAVNRPASPGDIEAQAGKTIEVEETAERPVISKSAQVTGEVEIGKETSEKTETVQDTVRKTEVDVERETSKGAGRQKPK